MRGKDSVTLYRDHVVRITPAYAGKSMPRERSGQLHQGSPPPMRGKVYGTGSKYHAGRITPAYAGKRAACAFSMTCCADHPRLCGEK